MKTRMEQTLKGLLASVGQALKSKSQKKFLHRHNSYLQNNRCLSKTEHTHVIIHAKKKVEDHSEKTILKIKVT